MNEGIEVYNVNSDKFELDEKGMVYSFPCNCCIHVSGEEFEEPCNSCGHNINADI